MELLNNDFDLNGIDIGNKYPSIDIAKLAGELGVDEKYYTYPAEDKSAAQAIVSYYLENIRMKGDGVAFVPAEICRNIFTSAAQINFVGYLPLFIERIEHTEKWKKMLFFQIIMTYITMRHIELKTLQISQIKHRDGFGEDIQGAIFELNDVEIFGTFPPIFLEDIRPHLHQHPIFHELVSDLRPLQEWYDDALKTLTKSKETRNEYYDYNRRYWSDSELPVATLFIGNEFTKKLDPKHFIPYIDRFLCHANNEYFDLLAGSIVGENTCYMARWKKWIIARKDLLFDDNDNEAKKAFARAFALPLIFIENGRLSKKAREKMPPTLVRVFDSIRPHEVKHVKRKTADMVGHNLENGSKSSDRYHHVPMIGRQIEGISGIVEALPTKSRIAIPTANSLFVSAGEGAQPESISFPEKYLPPGTTVTLERTIGGKKEKTFSLAHEGVIDIPAVENLQKDLHFSYVVRIKLPKSHIFANGESDITLPPYKIYVKAPKKFETASPVVQSREVRTTVSAIVPTVQSKVASVLETPTPLVPQKTLADTLTAWELSIEEDSYSVEIQDSGTVVFQIASDLIGELHEEAFGTISIDTDDIFAPHIQNEKITTILGDIARNMRHEQRETLRLKAQEEQEQAEYETFRAQFQPFYDFIAEQTFVDKNNTQLFDKASDEFRGSLKALNWSMPWRLTKDGQIQFRHTRNNVKITYSNVGALMNVVGESRALSRAEERCYSEIAEAFSHLALFYTAEYRERQGMIRTEKKFQNDMRQGADAYEVLLAKGQARLVQYSDRKGNIWSSKFPLDNKPQMLCEKASHDTLEGILTNNDNAELCYRRDVLRINGEINEEAGEQSVENTLQNLADLRQSPRARYILRKRILITLKFDKFSGDDTRAPLQKPQAGESQKNAYDLLLSFKEKKNVQSSKDVDDEFMDEYIDLLTENRIRVQYVWPLSSRLEDHQKHLAKKRKPTIAD